MTVQTSFSVNTTAADAIDTLNGALTSIGTLNTTVTALNNKIAAIPPLASFTTAVVSQNEGNSGTTTFVFPVTLDKVWASDLVYDYIVSASGTNPADASDFVGGAFPRGSITFPAGVTSVNVSVPVAGDTAIEPNENFTLRLYRVEASSLGTILNDDAAGARTTQPWSSGEQVYAMDPDQMSGADGSRVTAFTDPASGIAATAPGGTGPVLVKNVANGHAAIRFANNAAERLTLGRPAAIVSACAAETNWSYVLVIKSPNGTGTLASPFSDDYSNNGTFSVAYNAAAGAKYGSALVPFGVFPGDVRDDIKVLIYSGETIGGARGRHFYNGVPSQVSAGGTLAKTYDAVIGCGSNNGTGTFPYTGDILGLYIINKALSAPEALQAYLWACNKFGKTSPLAGRTYFPLFDGDSHTAGVGATNTTNYVSQLAIKRGWPVGAWGNVGKPSATVASTGVATANTMMDKAPRDTDGFADVTGLPVVLMTGEWYNQGGGGAGDGAATAGNNRSYATARKATGKFAKIGTWTSMASATRIGAARDSFNASLVSTPGDFNFVVPIHTDSTIGVDAQGSNTSVFPDGVHPNAAGYTVLTNLVDTALAAAGYSN